MSSFAELHARLQKPQPRVIDRQDRKAAEDAEYKRNSAIVRTRDGHCRVCGKQSGLSTHHVIKRSRARRSKNKHAVDRMITLCWGPESCHQQLEDGVLRMFPNSEDGTNGTMLIEKFDKKAKQWQVAMRTA